MFFSFIFLEEIWLEVLELFLVVDGEVDLEVCKIIFLDKFMVDIILDIIGIIINFEFIV